MVTEYFEDKEVVRCNNLPQESDKNYRKSVSCPVCGLGTKPRT